jgi:hypothetical protein
MWLYLTGSGDISVPELNDLASACSDAYASNILPYLSVNCFLDETQVVLYAGGSDVFEGIAAAGGNGAQTGAELPASLAACISWQIAPHYRGGHPRTYLCGLPSDVLSTPTTFTGSFLSNAESAAIAFHEDVEAITGISAGISTVEHGVASFVRDGAWRTPPVFYRIVSASVDSRFDTQRRRLGPDR